MPQNVEFERQLQCKSVKIYRAPSPHNLALTKILHKLRKASTPQNRRSFKLNFVLCTTSLFRLCFLLKLLRRLDANCVKNVRFVLFMKTSRVEEKTKIRKLALTRHSNARPYVIVYPGLVSGFSLSTLQELQ